MGVSPAERAPTAAAGRMAEDTMSWRRWPPGGIICNGMDECVHMTNALRIIYTKLPGQLGWMALQKGDRIQSAEDGEAFSEAAAAASVLPLGEGKEKGAGTGAARAVGGGEAGEDSISCPSLKTSLGFRERGVVAAAAASVVVAAASFFVFVVAVALIVVVAAVALIDVAAAASGITFAASAAAPSSPRRPPASPSPS